MENNIKIGEISKLCNIPIKTLRYYEELGLIKPNFIDKYTGYRYYNEENVKEIYKIQILKDLNFSLVDIKNFDENSLGEKRAELNEKIKQLKNKLNIISYLTEKLKGVNMKPFINDEKAIGKWNYECSCLGIDAYNNEDIYKDEDALVKELYFLPNGEGYWIFENWTNGELYHYNGQIYKYAINNNKLFLDITNENGEYELTMVFVKENSNIYKEKDLRTTDNTNLEFVLDKEALGAWVAVDYTSIDNKFNYTPSSKDNLFLKAISILEDGSCFWECSSGTIEKLKWTKDYILGKNLAFNYVIHKINGEQYLIMDWKSGDYVYGKTIYGCYVFKKSK